MDKNNPIIADSTLSALPQKNPSSLTVTVKKDEDFNESQPSESAGIEIEKDKDNFGLQIADVEDQQGNNNGYRTRGGRGGGKNRRIGDGNSRRNQHPNRFSNWSGGKQSNIPESGCGGGGGGGVGDESIGLINEQHSFQNRRDFRGSHGSGGGGGGGGGGGARNSNRGGPKDEHSLIIQKLHNLQGPLIDIPPIEHEDQKFSNRCRLYIGNLPKEITEKCLTKLFEPYGEIAETFISDQKNFAFLKLDYRNNAEKAKRELDGILHQNRNLRIRFAPNSTMVRVKNLTPFVTNELLFKAFEVFGKVEQAKITLDEHGRPSEGIVEYVRKSGAMMAVRYCNERCFFLTSSLRPCICELIEYVDDTDGYPEKNINKKNDEYFNERQHGPRFADMGSFEHEYGTRWKQLYELFKQKFAALKNEMRFEEEKLEAQMEYAKYEHETEMLREELRVREQDQSFFRNKWESRFGGSGTGAGGSSSGGMGNRNNDEYCLRMDNKNDKKMLNRQQRFNSQPDDQDEPDDAIYLQAQQILSALRESQNINQGSGNSNQEFGSIGIDGTDRQSNFDSGLHNFGGKKQSPFMEQQKNQMNTGYDIQENRERIGDSSSNRNMQWNDQRNGNGNFKRRRF